MARQIRHAVLAARLPREAAVRVIGLVTVCVTGRATRFAVRRATVR